MKDRFINAFNKTIDTCEYLINDIISLKKFYIVEVYTSGKYGNVITGTRFFLTRKSAEDFFYRMLNYKCDVKFKTLVRLSQDCYGEE